jgi:hypothetical protein
MPCAGVAIAADAFEPDDSVAEAYGPLNGDELFAAEISTAEDRDVFWFDTTAGGTFTATLTGDETCTSVQVQIMDAAGRVLTTGTTPSLTMPLTVPHRATDRDQYTISVTASAGCAYELSVDPPEMIAVRPPGVTVLLDHIDDSDTVQRVLVDGHSAGEVTNEQRAWLELGALAPDAPVTFEAQNPSGSWGWNARITATAGHHRAVIFLEREFGRYVPPPLRGTGPVARIGITRHVVLTPAGTVLESCGERNAPAPCFPVDADLDGITDPGDQCPLQVGVASGAGCPDRDGDTLRDSLDACPDAVGPVDLSGCPDADGDRVADRVDACPFVAGVAPRGCPKTHRYRTVVTLRHGGRRFTGRLLSTAPACRAGRAVRLRAARGTATLGRAKTGKRGAFTIVAPRRGGPFVVSAAEAKPALGTLCRAATSKPVR